ncbi:MAG: hypothetical protein KF729_16030 [Sandaracinaceae bacterium]|nr:hypothetical protein [Sandaracinaceae bacterium]
MRATLLALALLGSCDPAGLAPPIEAEPARRPEPPRFDCALAGPARALEGAAPALAPGALAVHDTGGRAHLHRLDAPSEPPIALDAGVLALARHGDGWIAVQPERALALDAAGASAWEVPLGRSASHAALALDESHAWIAIEGDDGANLGALALEDRRLGAWAPLASGPGALLVAPGRGGRAGGALHDAEGAPLEAPGPPLALAGPAVVFTARDRTGAWVDGPTPARVTRGEPAPSAVHATALGARILVAYTAEEDLFVQPARAGEGALGEPLLVAPEAVAAGLAAEGERFWIAWVERGGAVRVRAGECRGD